MSDFQRDPTWWFASDGKWYPPQPSPAATPTQLPPPPAPISSDQQIASNWWLASDGRWYPPSQFEPFGQTFTPTVSSVPATGRRSLSIYLVGLLQVFFWLTAVADLVAIGFALNSYFKLQDLWDTDSGAKAVNDAAETALEAYNNLRVSLAIVSICSAVVFLFLIIWANLSNKASRYRWHGPRLWGSGWTVTAWFIPVANFFLPKIVLNETERIGAAAKANAGVASEGWQRRRVSALGTFWFIFLVLSVFLIPIGSGFVGSASEVRWSGYGVLSLGLGIQAFGFVLGAAYVGKVSSYFD